MAGKPNRENIFVQIDENLKRVFDEDMEQDLPPRLMELMEKLDRIDAPAEGAVAKDEAGTS